MVIPSLRLSPAYLELEPETAAHLPGNWFLIASDSRILNNRVVLQLDSGSGRSAQRTKEVKGNED